jgi:hypothetical protein
MVERVLAAGKIELHGDSLALPFAQTRCGKEYFGKSQHGCDMARESRRNPYDKIPYSGYEIRCLSRNWTAIRVRVTMAWGCARGWAVRVDDG